MLQATFKYILLFSIICSAQYLSSQTRNLYIEGSGDQYGVIRTSSVGSSSSGIELIRSTEFSGTDWRIVNQGGTFRIFDGIDNFLTDGEENLRIASNGTMTILNGTEANVGNAGGALVVGNPDGLNVALDGNEILARNGDLSSNLLIQAGPEMGNTYINMNDGNVGIGDLIAPVKLSVFNGTDVTTSGGGYILVGSQNGSNIGIDNNEIMARDGSDPANLFLQIGNERNVSIGASEGETDTKLTIEDSGHQLKFTNSGDNSNDWYIGASGGTWNAGAGKLVFDDDSNSAAPILMLDRTQESVGIGISNIPDGFKFGVNGKVICEEVQVDLQTNWPDYVFEANYNLKPLHILEQEIVNLGHLPGYPMLRP